MFQIKAGNFSLSWGQKSVITDRNIVLSGEYSADLGKFISCFRTGAYAEANMLTLFATIPEVFAPVDRIADGVASGCFKLCKIKRGKRTDEEVEDNKQWNKLVEKPNWQETLYDLIYTAVVYELVCGNRYFYVNVAGSMKPRFENISSLWLLEPQHVTIREKTSRPKLFKTTSSADVIDKYEYQDAYENHEFKPEEITHETYLKLGNCENYRDSRYKGYGPLQAAEKPMSNLIAVYEARNVIYVKRGALGWIISEKGDADGRQALTRQEKEEIQADHNESYGLSRDKTPIPITRIPVAFIRTSMSIQELQPFEECAESAMAIMAILRVPKEVMPSKDGATYENRHQSVADFYRDVIIPKGESLAQTLTKVLKLEDEGLYIKADYNHIEALQENKKEKAEVDWRNNETARVQFQHGQITLNDWREAYGREAVSDAIYNKTTFQMTPEELEMVKSVINIKSTNNTDNQNTDNNEQPK